jgi:hypothetical protein
MDPPELVDISSPKDVEVQVREDGKVMWINVDGVCRLRCCNIQTLHIHDPLALARDMPGIPWENFTEGTCESPGAQVEIPLGNVCKEEA